MAGAPEPGPPGKNKSLLKLTRFRSSLPQQPCTLSLDNNNEQFRLCYSQPDCLLSTLLVAPDYLTDASH